MNDDQNKLEPWWRTTANVVIGILGLVGLTVGAMPMFSTQARKWYEEQWALGWGLVFVLIVGGSVFASLLLRHNVKLLATAKDDYDLQISALQDDLDLKVQSKQRLRNAECQSDVTLVDLWIEPFMRGGTLRKELCRLPTNKDFSRALSRGFEKLERDFDDGSKELFDTVLRGALDELRESFRAYWGAIEDRLDGPWELTDAPWDLRIMTPPGGNWAGNTESDKWESFYVFVRSLTPLVSRFLAKVDAAEKITHRLRIEAGLPPRT